MLYEVITVARPSAAASCSLASNRSKLRVCCRARCWYKGEQLLLFGGQNVVPAIEEEEDPKEILSEGKKLVLDELEAMDLNNTTPLDALFKLNEFKKKLREEL